MDQNINFDDCVSNIVNNLKSNGSFDQFRRECLADVDTKPSYRNLLQRVEGCVKKFFSKQDWNSSLNKAQLRNRLRNEINDSDMVRNGIHHLVDQVVNNKVRTEFKDKIEKSLKDYLGIKDPEEPAVKSEDSPNFVEEETLTKTEVKEQDVSDISSVHTSDLSDFDDEISISSDDDHQDSKKKKISLKVVKELTASISEEKKSIDNSSEQALSSKSTASSDTDGDQKDTLKRKRKTNLKFESFEPVKKLQKSSSVKKFIVDHSDDSEKEKRQGALTEDASTRQLVKRKQAEVWTSKSETKGVKGSVRTRKASISSESSTITEKPLEKRGRGRPRKAIPVDQNSNKRYDSSDLYKPRNSLAKLTSSRRTRSAADLDSNSNSALDDV